MNIDIHHLESMPVRDLQAAADRERQRANDSILSPEARRIAADQAAVLSALALVSIYESLPPCPLREIKVLEARRELAAALQDGADGYALTVYRHEYDVRAATHHRQYTGYVARYGRQPNHR